MTRYDWFKTLIISLFLKLECREMRIREELIQTAVCNYIQE